LVIGFWYVTFFILFCCLLNPSYGAGNLLPAMKPAAFVKKLDDMVSNIYSKIFGESPPHQCIYRQHLMNILKTDLKKQMSEYLSGQSCWKLNFFYSLIFLQLTPLNYLAVCLPGPKATPTPLVRPFPLAPP